MTNETARLSCQSLKEALHAVFGDRTEILESNRVPGGDINHAFRLRLSTGEKFFLKTNSIANSKFFITEAHGLAALRQPEAIGVPKILGAGTDSQKGISFLLLEYMESAPSVKNYWEVFGHELAALHKTAPGHMEKLRTREDTQRTHRPSCFFVTDGQPLPRYGFWEDNFIGANPQRNLPSASWIDFYRESRLMPQIKMADHYFDSGMRKKAGYLLEHLDRYLREPEFPSLLHGDLWSGNVLCGNDGKAWILDPAVYIGDFETDLAMTQLFGSFPSAFYSAYREVNPIDKGYDQRRELYHLYHLLNHLNLFGRTYLTSVKRIMDEYL